MDVLPIAEWRGRQVLELMHAGAHVLGAFAAAGAVAMTTAVLAGGSVDGFATAVCAFLALGGLALGAVEAWPWLRAAPVVCVSATGVDIVGHPSLPRELHIPIDNVAFVDLDSAHGEDVPRLLLGIQRANLAIVFKQPITIRRWRRPWPGVAVRVERTNDARQAFLAWPQRHAVVRSRA